MHVAERDRALERLRLHGARHPPDVTIAGPNAIAARGKRGACIERQSYESSRDAAAAAMQDANDDLLAHIAALGEADRTILDARLERDRVLVHVFVKDRPPGLVVIAIIAVLIALLLPAVQAAR